MTITVQALSPDVSVAPQLQPEAMAALAEAGYRSVINNRPEFEGGPTQPTGASLKAAAEAAGLAYAELPVEPGHQTPEQVARFAELLSSLPRPIVAFCRSGARSSKLFRAATGT